MRMHIGLSVIAASWSLASPVLAASEGEPSLFAGSFAQSLAAVIAFTVLFIVLRKAAWGPIIKGLQDRENKIREDLQKAEQANADAQKTLDEYKAKLAEAHAEARSLLDQTRADADALRTKMVADAEAEAARQRDRVAGEIDAAKNQALQDIYAQAAEIAVTVAGKILQRQIDAKDTQQLVDQSLAELNRIDRVN